MTDIQLATDGDDDYSFPPVERNARRVSMSDDSVTTQVVEVSNKKRSKKNSTKNLRSWEEMFSALQEYKDHHGHCNVPYYDKVDRHLGEWVNKQRKSRDSLPKNLRDALDSIGFDWQSTQDRIWNEKLARLQDFYDKHGHSSVPYHYDDGHGTDLANWASKQRQIQVQGRLSKERHAKLSALKFTWRMKTHTIRISPKEESKWKDKYQRLVAYKNKFGTCAVPFQYEHDKSLGRWVNEMRTQNKRGVLRPDRKALLEDIDFIWRIKSLPGECPTKKSSKRKSSKVLPSQKEIAPTDTINPPTKRAKKSPSTSTANTMTTVAPVIVSDSDNHSIASREDTTTPLQYNPGELDFDLMYRRLQIFQHQYGKHVDIPPDYSSLSLGPWLAAMKQQARAGQLPEDKARKLQDAGIVLVEGENQIWEERFGDLCDYVSRHGHAQVSQKEYPELAAWVSAQRRRFLQKRLSEPRRIQLQNIGFELHVSASGLTGIEEKSMMDGSGGGADAMPTAGKKDAMDSCSNLEVDVFAAAVSWTA
ncbi:helicase [Seminavis robusta]|uniref:Helicase n=1 Tax=Seminavis robusta TaxID=568900 RepID=A0A9N8DWM0_9STRA|nr:helicase [Seminavis robusta]|eukprot:Sro407_g136730.1 helicase (532) ;mRNA; f:51928-53523